MNAARRWIDEIKRRLVQGRPRLPMRRIRDVLRLCSAGMSKRQIAASLSVSATAAGECIRRAASPASGVSR